jgi:hypothetical protein
MKAFKVDNGQNRVLFVRYEDAFLGTRVEVHNTAYAQVAEDYFRQNTRVTLVMVEFGKVVFAYEPGYTLPQRVIGGDSLSPYFIKSGDGRMSVLCSRHAQGKDDHKQMTAHEAACLDAECEHPDCN